MVLAPIRSYDFRGFSRLGKEKHHHWLSHEKKNREPPTHGFSVHALGGLTNENKRTYESTPTMMDTNMDKLLQESPQLKQIIAAWPTLRDHIKQAIIALIETD